MALSWRAFHAQFLQQSLRETFQFAYSDIRSRNDDLAGFPEPQDLLDDLHRDQGEAERKDGILRILVEEAQAPSRASETAQILLVLALWPGCDAVYGRLLRHFPGNGSTLAAEIVCRLTIQTARLDLNRVNRIAATVLRNIERDVRRMLTASWQRAAIEVHVETVIAADPLREPFADRLRILRDIIPRDAGLVFAVVVLGLSQKEAAHALGLTHDAARKRFQRAMTKLQQHDPT